MALPGWALVAGSKSSVSSACANMPLTRAALMAEVMMSVVSDGRFRDAALRAREADRHLPGLELRSRHHRRQRVQDAVPGFPRHVRREPLLPRLRHVARQPPGDVRFRHFESLSRNHQ